MRLKFRTSLARLLETGVLNRSTSTSCSFSLMPLDTCLSSQHARGFTLSIPVPTCLLAHDHVQDIPVPTQSWLSSAARCHTGGQCLLPYWRTMPIAILTDNANLPHRYPKICPGHRPHPREFTGSLNQSASASSYLTPIFSGVVIILKLFCSHLEHIVFSLLSQ